MTVAWKRTQARRLSPEEQVDAFDRLFDEHWNRVYAVLFRLLGDRREAEALALEVFWRLYRDPPRQEGERLAGWLYRVATNLGFNALRASRRRARYEQAALPDGAAHSTNPATVAERRAEQAQVREILAAMPERQAKLLLLRYSGFSYAELAAALEVAPGSIGTLLARAEREFEQRYRAQHVR